MKRDEAMRVVAYLGDVARVVKNATGAPIIVVLCLGKIDGGSVLSGSIGTDGPEELAQALRFAADKTRDHAADHIFQSPTGKKLDS